MKTSFTLLLFIILFLSGCSKPTVSPVEIAINPWPGYEFLYLAEQKGFFEQVKLNAKLIQLDSLSDVQRSYVNGYADGIASTVIEAVQAEVLGGKPLEIVLVPDFSNGGDVIIADKGIKSVKDLKGKTVGCEVSSLGIYILQRALSSHDLKLSDVNVVNIEQLSGEQALLNGSIDAFISYPPVSINILKHDKYHQIFSSAEIPNEIIDTVSISKDALKQNPDFVPKLHKVWQMALDYYQEFPEDALKIMSKREGYSAQKFKDILSELYILDNKAQKALFSKQYALQNSVINVCKTLVHVESIETNCDQFPQLIHQGEF